MFERGQEEIGLILNIELFHVKQLPAWAFLPGARVRDDGGGTSVSVGMTPRMSLAMLRCGEHGEASPCKT